MAESARPAGTYDLVVRNVEIATSRGREAGDVAVSEGRIAAFGHGLAAGAEELDATGLCMLPGLVDLHVHFRQPGMTEKEDFESGSRSAAVGGVTTVFDMPNVTPPTSTVERFRAKLEEVRPGAHVDFAIYGIIRQENEADLRRLVDAGAIGFKLYMGETTGRNPCPDDAVIFGAMRICAELDRVVGVHAENDLILQRLIRELAGEGRSDPIAHLDSRPAWIEAEAITRAAIIARAAGARLHVHHVSSQEGLDSVVAARRLGSRVSAEVLIAHLLLDSTAYTKYGNLVKLNPPIRPRTDVEALWRGVASGTVDCIATDHAPHTAGEQAATNVWEAPGGFIGVETLLPLVLTEVHNGRLSLERAVELTSERPARIHRLFPKKGSLSVGADADFVLVDLEARYAIDASRLHSKHPVSPYHGREVVGRPIATYLRGRCIARNGEIVAPATGRLVVRPTQLKTPADALALA